MQRERPLDPDPEGLLADGERLAHAGALALDDDALEHLDALALALDYLEVHANGVPGFEPRDFTRLAALDVGDDAHRAERGTGGRGMLATAPWPHKSEPPPTAPRASDASRRQRATSAWLPDRSTSGTPHPRNCSGRV